MHGCFLQRRDEILCQLNLPLQLLCTLALMKPRLPTMLILCGLSSSLHERCSLLRGSLELPLLMAKHTIA